jgi:hypothetical protein
MYEQVADFAFDHDLQKFHRTALATISCYVVVLVVSCLTQNERDNEREQFTWSRFKAEHRTADERPRPFWQNDRVWACILVACTLCMCWFFA